jgi:hypothetical protein
MKKIESIFIGHKGTEIEDAGLIYVPYLFMIRPSDDEPTADDYFYTVFMDKYHKAHEICPVCGSNSFSTTLIGYIFDHSKPENYKDLNNCTCVACGDSRHLHDRISIEEFNIKNHGNRY